MDHTTRARVILVLVLLVGLLLAYSWPLPIRVANTIRENIALAAEPSAVRAYEFGNVHFDARQSSVYDIARAEKLYQFALSKDPTLLGVRHQLARIAFLRGDFPEAMMYINDEIAMPGGPIATSSYYMRGLIEGYMGSYDAAVEDYAIYVRSDPTNWAGLNDYAWVLLKANQPKEALEAINQGLTYFPTNPWLLNGKAIALYELKQYEDAYDAAKAASVSVHEVSEEMWLTAYPGNDPRVAADGIETLRNSINENMHRVEIEINKATVQ